MPRLMCWGQPVIYSCGERENWGSDRTRFALDDRLNNDFVEGAGFVSSASQRFTEGGLALRPFPFRVAVHSDCGNGPSEEAGAPYWNSCQAKDGCGNAGEHSVSMTEEQMIRWLLADA